MTETNLTEVNAERASLRRQRNNALDALALTEARLARTLEAMSHLQEEVEDLKKTTGVNKEPTQKET